MGGGARRMCIRSRGWEVVVVVVGGGMEVGWFVIEGRWGMGMRRGERVAIILRRGKKLRRKQRRGAER